MCLTTVTKEYNPPNQEQIWKGYKIFEKYNEKYYTPYLNTEHKEDVWYDDEKVYLISGIYETGYHIFKSWWATLWYMLNHNTPKGSKIKKVEYTNIVVEGLQGKLKTIVAKRMRICV